MAVLLSRRHRPGERRWLIEVLELILESFPTTMGAPMSKKQTPQEAWAELRGRVGDVLWEVYDPMLSGLDRLLRRWPWLYRKLG